MRRREASREKERDAGIIRVKIQTPKESKRAQDQFVPQADPTITTPTSKTQRNSS